MQGPKASADTIQNRLARQSKYLTLFIWMVGVCLSFGLYTLLVNALVHDATGEAHTPPHSPAAPDAAAVMKIDPAIKVVGPGEAFSVTIMIENALDLGAFEFELTYDPTVVQTTTVELGPFLGSTGRSITELGPAHGSGSVTYGAFSLPPPDDGPNGDGVLATLTFQATSVGTSALHLQNVEATDTDGVSLSPSVEDGEVIVDPDTAPTVTSISPDWGYVGAVVENVIVVGEKFQVDASVQLTKTGQDPILASLTDVQSSTRISCTLNLGKAAAGQWNVVVTNPDAQSGTRPNGFTVKRRPPTITSITPGNGFNDGVVHITNLAGANFQTGTTVKLTKAGETDINATNVVVVNDSQITCDLDLNDRASGTWDVVVTNPDSQSATLSGGFKVAETIQDYFIYLPLTLRNR
jgi:hypothetical protein